MAGWLSRTASLFQKKPQPLPEPFEVECDCGARVAGQRMASFQKPLCSVCEHPVFVLPANVYPQPVARSKPKSVAPKSNPGAKSGRTSVNSVVDDAPAPLPTSSRSSKNAAVKNSATGRRVDSPPQPEPFLRTEPRAPLFTPLRLISVAIVFVSGLTLAGLWYRHQFEVAKATASIAADTGMTALQKGDFAQAAIELKKAQQAVDLLNRKDPSANTIRRRSREATTLANLASSSLTDFLESTISTGKAGQAEPLRMASLDKDAWVIFDTNVIPVAEGTSRLLLDAPIEVKGVTVRIEIKSAALSRAARVESSTENPRLIFAAQLDQMSPPRGDPPTSVLELNGESAFLWTSYDSYLAMGYKPLETEKAQIQALLDRQLLLE